jgi:hypothetical protein
MIMFYLSLLVIFILTYMGKLSGDNFLLVFGWCISAFVIGNVGEWKYKDSSVSAKQTASKSVDALQK